MTCRQSLFICCLMSMDNHSYSRLEGTYNLLHKTTCEAAAKENNAGFWWYGEPAKPGEWRPWEASGSNLTIGALA